VTASATGLGGHGNRLRNRVGSNAGRLERVPLDRDGRPGLVRVRWAGFSHVGTVFRLRATGAGIVVDGHDLTLVTAGLSAITLITGFVVFANGGPGEDLCGRSSPLAGRQLSPGIVYTLVLVAVAGSGGWVPGRPGRGPPGRR